MIDLFRHRLHNQHLTAPGLAAPEDIVAWLGAVQSQDFLGAKWSVGQRVAKGTDAMVEEAFNRGRILRTHVLRPTWHFVALADIRWMLELTAPHVRRFNAVHLAQGGGGRSHLRCEDVAAPTTDGYKGRCLRKNPTHKSVT